MKGKPKPKFSEPEGRQNYRDPFLRCICLFMRDTGREAETQAEGEAGSLWGARCGTRSQEPRITPWAKGRRSTTELPRFPLSYILC